MIKSCVFYSAIIVLFDSAFADPDLTLIFESKQKDTYNASCVIGGNALKEPIYWTQNKGQPVTSRSSPRYVPKQYQMNFDGNETDYVWEQWNISDDSIMKLFGPVIDERWEMFQTENLTKTKNLWTGGNFVSVSVSVFISNMDYTVYIGDNYYIQVNSVFSSVAKTHTIDRVDSVQFRKPYDVWLHFAITKIGNEMRLTFFPNKEQITWNIFKAESPNFINISKGIRNIKDDKTFGFLKLHKYKYLYSEDPFENAHEIIGHSHKGGLCIVMFVAVCDSCSLNLIVSVDEEKVNETSITAEENQKGHYLWRRIEIKENVTVKNNIKMFAQKINPKGNRGFWAIDDIRLCDSSEVRIVSINRHSNTNISCHSLADTKFSVSGSEGNVTHLTCDSGQLGESCNISCQSIFQRKDYCGNIICINSGCSCSWGFHGENCNEECNSNFWGENCKNECGKCENNEVCNRFNGACKHCQKHYTGAKCTGSLPVLYSKPIVIGNPSYTSVKIGIEKRYTGSYLPTEILIQYRKQSEKKWKTYSTCTTKYEDFHICDINNLTSSTVYEIRAVLVAKEGSLRGDGDTPILNTTTTCKDITTDTFHIKPNKTSAQVIFNLKDPTLCKLNTYTMKLLWSNHFRDITETDIQSSISDLLPYTEYRISFCNKSTTLCTEKSFRTKPARPGIVSNVTWDSSSNEILLAWSAPPKSGKTIDYNVTYKLYRHKACSSNITQVPLLTESINKTQIVLQNLIAYSDYEIDIQATNEPGHGGIVRQTITTKESDDIRDELPTNVTVIHGEIQITPPSCEQVKGPLQYTINYTYNDSQLCVNGENVSVDVNYDTEIMKLDHSEKLKPYSQYLVTILARRNESSYSKDGQKYQYTTKPSRPPKVAHLMVYSKNGSHVWLRWIAPCPSNGKLEIHLITVTPTSPTTLKPFNITVARRKSTCFWGKEYECAVIKNLTQNQSYRFEVQAKNRNVKDYGEAAIIKEVRTREEESEPPNNLTYQFEANELLLKWIHPDVTNGPLRQFNIDGYIVETGLENKAQNISEKYLVERDQLDYKKKLNATPATVFNISVVAINSKMGKPAYIEVIIPPPEPKLSSRPFIMSCLEGTCSINISSFSNCINCSAYLVVSYKATEYTKSPLKETPFYEMISKNEENIKILQSQHWIAANISSLENVQNISIGKAMGGEPVYNDGNSLMHIILVSYYKGEYNTKTYYLDYGTEESKFNNLYFLLSLLVVPLAVLSFFTYRFCKKDKEESKTEERSINANLPLVKNAERIPEDAFPLMTLPPPLPPKLNTPKEMKHKYSKVIELKNFKSYLKKAAEGDTTHNQLSKQHEMCKGGYNKSVEIGLMERNKKKNRYRDLVAYDHTRVKLKCIDENGSDYINANYIHGYNTKKAYIATQGPKANTVNDFWHMIWEQDVGNIVMLANVIESGKKKCEEYWPALDQTMKFQDISVQNIKTNVFSSYIYREFQVTCKGTKRIINHLHFTLWPDHGVPLYPQNLVPFMKEMLKIPQGTHLIVVHCSAGIGRTGTILLCDIVLRMAALEHKVDFLKIYHQLREQRPNMVDNPAQYILAHLVVYECLFGKDFSIPLDGNFKNSIENLLTEASIKSMMDYLEEVSWQIKIMQEYFHNQLSYMNKEKNRFSTILPGCSQVYLERYPEDDESSDYINALSMNCFQHQDRFIVTQQPLPNTVGDFWRLILQYDVNTIVSLNEIRRKDKTSCIFWPKRNESFYPVDYIKVAHQNEEDRGDFNVITVVITDEYENKKRFISLICLNGWMPDTSTPGDPSGILAVRNYMFNTTFGNDNFIVVTCYDGTKASGLFVALCFLIEKIKLEHSCDVMLAVSTVRERRMQCFRDKEQFKFLLKAALLYFESFEMYSNFDNL